MTPSLTSSATTLESDDPEHAPRNGADLALFGKNSFFGGNGQILIIPNEVFYASNLK